MALKATQVPEMRIDGSNRSTGSSFYYTEGLKREANDADTVRADLYVDSAWLSTSVRAGLWGVGKDSDGDVTAYPIVEFTTAGDSGYVGWRIFNDEIGGWTDLSGVGYSTNAWNALEVSYNSITTAFDFHVNGQPAGSSVAVGSVDLESVILNNFNYGPDSADYAVRWSNFALGEYLTSPSVKDDCKNGKWAVYNSPSFKNQGQCVSSVVNNKNN